MCIRDRVYAFRTSEANAVQNIQLVGTKDDERLSSGQLHERNENREIGIDLHDEVDGYVADADVEGEDAPVLEDERAPVDALLDPMVGQRYVIEETEDEETRETRSSTDAARATG